LELQVTVRFEAFRSPTLDGLRIWASGITSLVRLGGWAVAPFAAGFLMQGVALATPLLIGAGMKIGYDLLLWRSFQGLKPPEERG
jgi:hypothetical protein